ncbi:sigma-70 family RNA polymerase sigma factor [Leeia aquatica]|uniref:Sigma-70 family RNA polymerase sigma factor n=1 Tax=Leeia aquatica TaxID=2725557 RepID=A0A847S902_9NEIS|nr:sigma-70 family RNA polymerase sigma factor [Leeia aquatica]NLR76243.1 sigma-70 family RNA polymerase sigma factor [Leeia aquatica]
MADFLTELQQHRDYLYRYALLQLRDPDQAEDVTQETLLAAVEQKSGFAGKSSLKTWLTGILKFKIIDVIRARSREPLASEEQQLAQEGLGELETLFDERGHWATPNVSDWSKPEHALSNSQFWQLFEWCQQRLPVKTAQAFMMREVMGLEIAEICKALEVTATNCSVLLYRARMGLRTCLNEKWFDGEARTA